MTSRTTTLTFYVGRDNTEDLVLLRGDQGQELAVDPSSITRIVVGVDDDAEVVDSSSAPPGTFLWPVDVVLHGQPTKGIRLNLGAAGLEPRTYGDCRLTVFDPSYPNGLVWTENLKVKVRA